jgi:hypothetical protein
MTQTEATSEPRWPSTGEHSAGEDLAESGEWEPADAVERAPRTFEFAALLGLVVAQIAWVLLLGYLVDRALGTSLVP